MTTHRHKSDTLKNMPTSTCLWDSDSILGYMLREGQKEECVFDSISMLCSLPLVVGRRLTALLKESKTRQAVSSNVLFQQY